MRVASTVLLSALLLGCRPTDEPSPPPDPADTSESIPTADQLELRGRVLGHDDQPLAVAHVTLRRNGYRKPILDGPVESDGRFQTALPGAGAYDLTLAGVDHASKELALWVDDVGLEISARLGTHARTAAKETVGLRLRWMTAEGRPGEPTETTATRTEQNVFVVQLDPPADARALQYQLTGLTEGRTLQRTWWRALAVRWWR